MDGSCGAIHRRSRQVASLVIGTGDRRFFQLAITLTKSASSEIKKIIYEQKLDPTATYLRLGVKGGGCSGFSYTLDLTESCSEADEQFELEGIKVICDSKSYIYLNEVTLDFKDELMGKGFVFFNPTATHTCGCGSSFSA